jgi:Family of unknown function (DUF5678)
MTGKVVATPVTGEASTEADWLFSQNLAVYAGQWVAVLHRTILAHGNDLKAVYAEAIEKARRVHPRLVPLFYSVPSGISGGA